MRKMPNPPELVLLKALWARGALPIRSLHEVNVHDLEWSFSSTRKTVERMAHKGFVTISIPDPKKPALVSARISKTATLAHMSRAFFGCVLEVDGVPPASAFTGSRLLSDDELEEVLGLLGIR